MSNSEWKGIGSLIYPLNDNIGCIGLVDKMGSDSRIVQAARVSYGKGTKSVSEDTGLIRYLMRHKHTSPFEMPQMLFLIKLPIYVARQLVRHRTASLNEESGRYSEVRDEFHIPRILRKQSKDNKQGSKGLMYLGFQKEAQECMRLEQDAAHRYYKRYLDRGMAKEQARINLPLATYTTMYWQMDLLNLFRFLKLRCDSHAQEEIRVYADAMLALAKEHYPIATQAFIDYWQEGLDVSKHELEVIKLALGPNEIAFLESMFLSKMVIGNFGTGEALELINRWIPGHNQTLDTIKEYKRANSPQT